MVTPAPVKPLTGPLKTAVKLIGELFVGSAWPAAWLIVTAGGVASGRAGVVALAEVECAVRVPAGDYAAALQAYAVAAVGMLFAAAVSVVVARWVASV